MKIKIEAGNDWTVMTNKVLLLLMVFLTGTAAFGQDNYKKIAISVCGCYQAVDPSEDLEVSKAKLHPCLMEQVSKKTDSLLLADVKILQKSNPRLSVAEGRHIMADSVRQYLTRNCSAYRQMPEWGGKKTEAVRTVAKDVCQCLQTREINREKVSGCIEAARERAFRAGTIDSRSDRSFQKQLDDYLKAFCPKYDEVMSDTERHDSSPDK